MPTKIEWTDEVWNIVTGCTKVGPGCENCYAERDFPRAYSKDVVPINASAGITDRDPDPARTEDFRPRKFTDVRVHRDRLEQPLRWQRPRRIFVCSMGDLFHEQVPDEFIDAAFFQMMENPRHTFQVLTKRPERMRDYVTSRPFGDTPLPNVWLGVSAEDQKTADERIPVLLDTPAAVRFVSAEPLLGPIVFGDTYCDWLGGWYTETDTGIDGSGEVYPKQVQAQMPNIDWVIVGGESGPNARPMHPDWARSIRDQCQEAGVPFFFKQQGCWVTTDRLRDIYQAPGSGPIVPARLGLRKTHVDGDVMWQIDKKAAGRILDGRTWDEFPDD